MNCPHLKESPYLSSCKLLSCKANKEMYIPSIVELDEYCKKRRHTLCPFFPVKTALLQVCRARSRDMMSKTPLKK